MYADKEIKAPGRCIKHVRAGSCTSIKADKCFVQLMGGQIATLGDRRAARLRDGGRRGRAKTETELDTQGSVVLRPQPLGTPLCSTRTTYVFSISGQVLCRKAGSRCSSMNPSVDQLQGAGTEFLRAGRAEKRSRREKGKARMSLFSFKQRKTKVLAWVPACPLCSCHHVLQFFGEDRSVLAGIRGEGPFGSSCPKEIIRFPQLLRGEGALCKQRSRASPRA